MVTRGTLGAHGCSIICEASSKGRVEAYLTIPWIPPFSPTGIVEAVVPPVELGLYSGLGTVTQKFVWLTGRAGLQAAKGALPYSIQLPWLVSPDQPSEPTHGGSMRPVEDVEATPVLGFAVPAANPVDSAKQSALAQ